MPKASSGLPMTIALALSHPIPRRPAPARAPLVGLDRAELRAALTDAGLEEREARMRSSQLWNWIYVNGVTDFSAMTNIAKPVRALLAERFAIERPEIVSEQVSSD